MDGLAKPITVDNNYTEVFVDGPDCLSMLIREIENAKHFIHIQVMLFYSDNVRLKLANALEKKAKEGVEVRVLNDSLI